MFSFSNHATTKLFDDKIPSFSYDDVDNLAEIGSGSFSVVSTAIFDKQTVVLKKFKNYTSIRDRRLMAKEAALLAKLRHENIVRVIGACENPPTIMFELCQFSFEIFNSDTVVTNLNQFLEYLHETSTYEKFVTKVGNTIAKDLTAAITFLHNSNMVHRDIKPENALVSNQHYSQEKDIDDDLIKKKPVIVKLADLGEARSAIIKTKVMQSTNANTKDNERGTPAYRAPEVLVKEMRSERRADINQLKKSDVWSLMMTVFITLNPNQRMPYENDDAETEDDIIELMTQRKLPSPSGCYQKTHATQYQMLNYVYQEVSTFEPDGRKDVNEIHSIIEEEMNAEVKITPLSLSQATALERSDELLAEVYRSCQNTEISSSPAFRPINDGTNACSFLTLGVIDSLADHLDTLSEVEIPSLVESVIVEFPSKFNLHRDPENLYESLEALDVLNGQKLLKKNLVFLEDILAKHVIYSPECSKHLLKELSELLELAKEKKQYQFAVFQGGIYIFALCVSPKGVFTALDTHPVVDNANGDKAGVVASSSSIFLFIEWLIRRVGKGEDATGLRLFIMKVKVNDFGNNHSIPSASGDEIIISDTEQDDTRNDEEIIIIDDDGDDFIDTRHVRYPTTTITAPQVLTQYHWNDVAERIVEKVPFDIDGDEHFVVKNNERKQLLAAVRDGRAWMKDSGTKWAGYKNVRSRNCKGGLVCQNEFCDFKVMNGAPNYYHFINGLCRSCRQTPEEFSCPARKYTAFKDNEGHVFHVGKHVCKAVPPKPDQIVNIVDKTLSVEPYVTPARVQSAVILDALRSGKPLDEVMGIVNNVTNRKAISNEMIKKRSQWRNGDSMYVAIRSFKERLEGQPEGKFLIYSVDEEKDCIFKTSQMKLQLARDMGTTGHFMNKEFCFFDGKHNRVRDYVTLTASTYHPVLCKQVPLASLECRNEDSDSVEFFWRTFNSAIKEFDESDAKFQPIGWVTDMKGANFIGLAKIYGDDITEKIKGCEFHFQLSVQKQAKIGGEEFKTLAYALLEVVTPEAFEQKRRDLLEFIETNHLALHDWLKWWMDRKCVVFRAFRGYHEPKMNQQEVVHAGWKSRDRSNATLLDAAYFDVRDSLLLVSEIDKFANGAFAGGSGANYVERSAKRESTEMEAAARYGEELLRYPPTIKSEDSFEPPKKKTKKVKALFEGRYNKVMNLKDIMKIAEGKEVSVAERLYYVKNSNAGTARFTVAISLSPSCTCTDFKKNGGATNCIHILFVLIFALKCTDKKTLVRRQFSTEEMNRLMATPLAIPDSIAAKMPKKRTKSEILAILRKHPSFGITQQVKLHKKEGRKANCKQCKADIEVGTTCLRVSKAIVAPCDSDQAELRDVSFCKKKSCINNPPPYVHVVLPQAIHCTADVPESDVKEVETYFTVIRM